MLCIHIYIYQALTKVRVGWQSLFKHPDSGTMWCCDLRPLAMVNRPPCIFNKYTGTSPGLYPGTTLNVIACQPLPDKHRGQDGTWCRPILNNYPHFFQKTKNNFICLNKRLHCFLHLKPVFSICRLTPIPRKLFASTNPLGLVNLLAFLVAWRSKFQRRLLDHAGRAA